MYRKGRVRKTIEKSLTEWWIQISDISLTHLPLKTSASGFAVTHPGSVGLALVAESKD